MKKRLFLYTLLIIFIALLGFFAASVYVTYTDNISLAKETVAETTQICAGLYTDNTDVSSFVQVGGDTRITIVAPDGTVLADSSQVDVRTLENHLHRPEIQAAAKGSPTAYVRHSGTLGVDLIYYALKVKSGDSYVFIRTAIPVARVDAYLYRSLPLLVFLLFLVALLSFFFIRGVVNRVVTPFGSVEQKLRLLANGKYKPNPVAGSYEEIDEITRNIDNIAFVLQKSINDLRDEKSKLDYIINNIGDGLFVVNENKSITLINSAALDIFNVQSDMLSKNLHYLSYDKSLANSIEDCVSLAKSSLFELTRNGNIYLVSVKRLPDNKLTMVVLSDVTENRENAKRREQFFANASHELKTPLTAIKGFNELAALNNKDENIRQYLDRITRETDRMMWLIGDMLKLSELENTKGINPVAVSLAKIVSEARETVSASIKEKAIIFETAGDGIVTAEPRHVYELIKNIIENAVRYNNQGGKISVKIESGQKAVQLTVSDNGIGISPKEQTRIFERFYRVEKSRSQRNGGTGLGLSIVKHICVLYNWKLLLKSKLSSGTEITVIFGTH
ncbi:MAG: ATP-binding protein [Firmicutes bacterium]|nr:ATP-binding protein [Bacillota bacterium]